MVDIFLSYAREDRAKAEPLAAALGRQGWKVWWDVRGLRGGDRFDEVIEAQLEAARCVVVLWSDVSRKSHWVRDEASEARDQNKYIPVSLDGERPPLGFRGFHARDLSDWSNATDDGAFADLVADISARIGRPTEARVPNDPPPKKREPSLRSIDALGERADFEVFRHIDAPWCPEMVVLPAGEFVMGSEEFESDKPPHRVRRIGDRFAIGKYPVTFAEYDHFCEATKRENPKDQGWGRGRRPVINVSLEDARAYVAWLSKETGQAYRLPSEAEWEYACRAGTTTRYAFGDEITPDHANYDRNVGKTTEVGSYPANPWGLHDMHGNVWEWIKDCWHDGYENAPADGRAWVDGGDVSRVLRGGSWDLDQVNARSANRVRINPSGRGVNVGFRVVCSSPSSDH